MRPHCLYKMIVNRQTGLFKIADPKFLESGRLLELLHVCSREPTGIKSHLKSVS